MLNRLVRYYPIIKFLKLNNVSNNILELGSGALGIGEFFIAPFIGVDIKFTPPFSQSITPVYAHGSMLPFKDSTFDVVVCLDTLEHVEMDKRRALLSELIRVSHKHIIVGFPYGEDAKRIDMRLYRFYVKHKLEIPQWLAEHAVSSYPNDDIISEDRSFRVVKLIKNENLWLHLLMMKSENYAIASKMLAKASHFMSNFCGWVMDITSIGKPYRKIYILEKLDTL
jgi:SAM-dependent methyltransferase